MDPCIGYEALSIHHAGRDFKSDNIPPLVIITGKTNLFADRDDFS